MEINKQQTLEIKGIAVLLLLLFHHFFYNTDINFIKELRIYSKITVGIFVFLSGYGLTASYSKSELGVIKYFKKNIFKLYRTYIPVFFVSILIGEITKIRTISDVYGENFIKIILDMFGILYFLEGVTFNATWWYISLAILLYIIFAIFYKGILKIKNFNNRVIIVGIISLILLITPKIIKDDILSNIIRVAYGFDYIVLFGIGIFSNLNKREVKKYFEKNRLLLFLFFIGLSILRVYKLGTKLDIVLVFLLCGLYSIYSSKLKYKFDILKFLGSYSFEIFLTHTFIYYYYLPDFTRFTKYESINFMWFLILSVILAFLVNKSINKIFLRKSTI